MHSLDFAATRAEVDARICSLLRERLQSSRIIWQQNVKLSQFKRIGVQFIIIFINCQWRSVNWMYLLTTTLAIKRITVESVPCNCTKESTDNQWKIAVTDTGVGIAKEDQASIFEPYVQAGSTGRPHLPDSTGLGLAIVLRLVKLMQGKIELVSQVGVSSTFTVILPLAVKTLE